MEKKNTLRKKAAAVLKGTAVNAAANASGKKYTLFFYEREVPEAVRSFLKRK